MTANVGTIDRVIRVVMGLALLSMIFLVSGPARWIGLMGIIPLMTSMMGSCPLYSLFGVSTCPLHKK